MKRHTILFPKDAAGSKAEKERLFRGGLHRMPKPMILSGFYAIIKSKSKERVLSGIRENV